MGLVRAALAAVGVGDVARPLALDGVARQGAYAALNWALNTALDLYQDRKSWSRLRRNGMAMDHSWKRQGALYVELFRRIAGWN